MKKMSREELQKKWAAIEAKAWTDEKFKERLLKDPEGVLKEQGFPLKKGQRLEIHEETDKIYHLILPKKPPGDLSEEELRNVGGGRGRDLSAHAYCGGCR
jgi:hypothetical protein